MELQQLIEKGNAGELTSEEHQELFGKINEEFLQLKETDPEKYLKLLKDMNAILEDLNKDIESL